MALKITLITGRTINQGVYIENKAGQDYLEAAACCELNANDIEALGGKTDSNVRVKTEFGEVVVTLKQKDGNPDGIGFIPMGPWANAVVDPCTNGCGMPGFKGMAADVEVTDNKVLLMKELMAGYK